MENLKDEFERAENLTQRLKNETPELFARTHRANVSFPKGWYDLLQRLFFDVKVIVERDHIEGFDVVQVKEKFGGLRVYVDGSTSEIADRISLAETEAWDTCEECGAKGAHQTSTPRGWLIVACDEHDPKKGG